MFSRIFLILVVSLLTFVAQADEIYTVRNIKIAASDKNAAVARNMAIEKGQLKAFYILVKRHFPQALDKVASLDSDKILNTVAGFELADERRSATNYFAKLDVKFSRQHFDRLMNEFDANFVQDNSNQAEKTIVPAVASELPAAVYSPTITSLLVPVFEQAGQTYWFDDENKWLDFWQGHFSNRDLKDKFILPAGDLEDMTLLNKDILMKNLIDLDSLFQRYNVNNIILVKLGSLETSPKQHLTLQVNYINKYNMSWQQHSFSDLEGDDLKPLLKEAQALVIAFNYSANGNFMINNNAANFTLTNPFTIKIDYAIAKLSDWVILEKLLKASPYIEEMKLEQMQVHNYKLSLTYKISFLDLQSLFQANNFDLQDQGDNHFLLTRVAADATY